MSSIQGGSEWLIYSLLCLILWGLWGFFLKLTYGKLEWVQTYMLSGIASFIVMLVVVAYYRIGMPGISTATVLAFTAGVFGGLGYIFFIKALEKGKVSVVMPLTALYPAITVIIALIVLKEKPNIYQWIGILLAIVAGVFLSAK